MWVLFLLSSFGFGVAALMLMYLGNKMINAMKGDDYKFNEGIKLYEETKKRALEKETKENE